MDTKAAQSSSMQIRPQFKPQLSLDLGWGWGTWTLGRKKCIHPTCMTWLEPQLKVWVLVWGVEP